MSKDKKPEIRDEIRKLADDLKPRMKAQDPKAGTVNYTFEQNPFDELVLPDTGVDLKQLKKIQKGEQQFVEALALATGELTNDAFEADNTIKSGSVDVKVGNNRASVHYDTIVEPGEGADVAPEYGQVLPTYRVQATSSKAGMDAVKNHLASQAKKLLG